MEPASASLVLSAGSSLAGGLADRADARAEKQQAEINAFIGRTRALQSDAVNKENLESDLGSLRAAMGANGEAPGVGSLEILRELRRTRGREHSTEFGNRMQESFAFRRQARNADLAGRAALLGGIIKAGPSLFDLAQLRRKEP